MIRLFDSHCHVDEKAFDEDRQEVLVRMSEGGITRCAVIGSDMVTSRHAADFAASQPGMYAAVGIHPHEASGFRESDPDTLALWLKENKVRAIGEIGLDYHYDLSPREVQREVCEIQMELAWQLGVPVVYHVREAHQDMLDLMKRHGTHLTPGIIHCFSGSAEIAREYLKLDMMISFSGSLTFKKAPRLCEAAVMIPRDRLLAETDSPYMSPEPVRGRRNEPANVRYVVAKLAELRGDTFEEAAAYTFRNASDFYHISDDE